MEPVRLSGTVMLAFKEEEGGVFSSMENPELVLRDDNLYALIVSELDAGNGIQIELMNSNIYITKLESILSPAYSHSKTS